MTFDLKHLQRITCDVMELPNFDAIEQSAEELLQFICCLAVE